MKLRMQNNSVRLRLTRSEVAKIAAEGSVNERVQFPNGSELIYELVSGGEGQQLSALFRNERITVHAPEELVEAWAGSDRVGMEGVDGSTRILVEKDFQCTHGEKDPDAFEAATE